MTDQPMPPSAPQPTVPGSPEAQQRAAQSRHFAAALGEIITILMHTAAYRTATLAQIERLVIPALLSEQYSLIEAQSKQTGYLTPAAVVLWASVNAETEAILASEPAAYQRLQPADWRSGDIIWVMDAVGDARIVGPMLQRLHTTRWQGRVVKAMLNTPDGRPEVRTLTPRT